jgi:hypothetical protein
LYGDPVIDPVEVPKAELHLHIEGTLEPGMVFALARKHGVKLKYPSVEALRDAYDFHNLQSFLDIYYEGANVLRDEDDFHAMTAAYIARVHDQGVVHVEIFFDPQTHTDRGIAFETVLNGIRRGLDEAQTKFGISSRLIMCFLRHLSAESALETLQQALPHRNAICAESQSANGVFTRCCQSTRCTASPPRQVAPRHSGATADRTSGTARSAARGGAMSAAGPSQGARPPLGGAARSAARGEP